MRRQIAFLLVLYLTYGALALQVEPDQKIGNFLSWPDLNQYSLAQNENKLYKFGGVETGGWSLCKVHWIRVFLHTMMFFIPAFFLIHYSRSEMEL
jgi:hypothetical protein